MYLWARTKGLIFWHKSRLKQNQMSPRTFAPKPTATWGKLLCFRRAQVWGKGAGDKNTILVLFNFDVYYRTNALQLFARQQKSRGFFFKAPIQPFRTQIFSVFFFCIRIIEQPVKKRMSYVGCHVDLFVDIGSWLYWGRLIGQFSEPHNFWFKYSEIFHMRDWVLWILNDFLTHVFFFSKITKTNAWEEITYFN